jgi:hypothetical protein
VRGLFYFNDADTTLAVSTPVVGTTGGRVILRSNYTTATIRLAVKQNTDGVAAIPALTQIANDIWEIGLSEFTITTGGVITVTDNRIFARSAVAIDVARGVGLDSRNRLGIADEGVTAAMLADDAVTTDKILDGAVTAAKIANRTRTLFVQAVGSSYTIGATGFDRVRGIVGVPLVNSNDGASAYGAFSIPLDFVSGATLTPLVFSNNSSLSVQLLTVANGGAIGEDWNLNSVSDSGIFPITANKKTALDVIDLTGFAASDIVEVRTISQPTMGITDLFVDGWLLSYTADS